MRHLHPVAWLTLCVSFAMTLGAAGNILVTMLVLLCTAGVSIARHGPRASAFGASMRLGVFLAALALVMGLIVGPDTGQSSVLLDVPELNLGAGSDLGGVYTVYRMVASLTQAARILTLCALLGLAWQACPAGQWCDFAETVLGRGALLLAPLLSLGEATVRARQGGYRRWQLGPAIVEEDLALVASWQRHARRSARRPWAVGSMLTVLGAMVVVLVPLGVAAVDGVDVAGVRLSGLGAFAALGLGAVAVRLVVRRWRFTPPVRMRDIGACMACGIPVGAVLAATYTGDATHFAVPFDAWPGLPLITVAGLLVCTAAFIMAQGAARGAAEAEHAKAGTHA